MAGSSEYPGLRALVQGDVDIWGEFFAGIRPGQHVGLLAGIRLALLYAGLRAALVYRLAHELQRRRVPIVPLVLTNLNISLHGFDIPPNVPVGPRFYVPHPVGTVISAERIGSGVTLVSGVTIGMRKGADFPIIGDGAYVGAGARILGRVTVGDRAQIGANAVVLKDVPADHSAVGVPATIRPPRPA
jgi:serine O-acetyltransferase